MNFVQFVPILKYSRGYLYTTPRHYKGVKIVTIKELRSLTGLTQAKFAEKYEIPRRTIEDWERDLRTPPEYVVKLLEYRITHELAEQ